MLIDRDDPRLRVPRLAPRPVPAVVAHELPRLAPSVPIRQVLPPASPHPMQPVIATRSPPVSLLSAPSLVARDKAATQHAAPVRNTDSIEAHLEEIHRASVRVAEAERFLRTEVLALAERPRHITVHPEVSALVSREARELVARVPGAMTPASDHGASGEQAGRESPGAPRNQPVPVRYYTRRDEAPLRPGETLGFIAGRGYFARQPTGRPTAHARQAAPKYGLPQAAPTYHTHRSDVPLLPGQTLGYERGKGYYAKGAVGLPGKRRLESASNFKFPPVITGPPIPDPGHVTVAAIRHLAHLSGLRATTAEISYSLRHPAHAIQTFVLAGTLFEFVKAASAKPYHFWGPHYDLTNGAPDAFLHAAWAGILALRYGRGYARTITTLHETGTSQRKLIERNARRMDLNNNAVGIALARAIEESPPPSNLTFDDFGGLAHNAKEAELLTILLLATRPKSGIRSGLETLGPPGATEAEVKRNPTVYSLATGKPLRR